MGPIITARVLQHLHHPTLFRLSGAALEPAALAKVMQLQHLTLEHTRMPGVAIGVSALLSQLQRLQQVSVLSLPDTLRQCAADVARYAALTASTQVSSLNLRSCLLPQGAWHYVLRAGMGLQYAAYAPPCVCCTRLNSTRSARSVGAALLGTSVRADQPASIEVSGVSARLDSRCRLAAHENAVHKLQLWDVAG